MRAPTAIRFGLPSDADRLAEQRGAVVGLVDGHDLADVAAPEMERDVHPRQDVDRIPIGRDQRAGDPAVRVVDVAEAREVALEAGEVLEVG